MPTGMIRRGASYSLRRVVPLDLREAYGRREIVIALGTKDYAEAKVAHAEKWVQLDRDFKAMREKGRSPALLPAVDNAYDFSPTLLAGAQLEELRAGREAAAKDGRLAEFMADAREALQVAQAILDGAIVQTTYPLWHVEGVRNAYRQLIDGTGGVSGSVSRRAREELDARKGLSAATLIAIQERWENERKPSGRTISKYKAIIAEFSALYPQKGVSSVTRDDARKFRDALLLKGQTAANVNVKLEALGVLFSYAEQNDLSLSNPFSKIRVHDPRTAREKRRSFTVNELNSIFSGPVYEKQLRPAAGGGEASFWLPLLGLFTGGRLNELGQLFLDDIYEEEYSGHDGTSLKHWVVRFVPNRDRGQRLKNQGSERRIPLHNTLLELGLLTYIDLLRQAGEDRLFPNLKANTAGELTGNWSKWFARYRRKELGLKDRETPFHALRHTFKDQARASEIRADVHNAITGHETGDVADSYGGLSYPLGPLVRAMERYRIPALKLPEPWKPKD